ncbi:MAG TPA: cytochrome c biogenesis protein CcsA [Armatimonadota bacterium]|nr:cytochrome c biogenesis protein CcsA [Armatimonadota bacterium]
MLTARDALFGMTLLAYFLGAVIFPANLFLKHPRLNRIGVQITFVGMLCHTGSIILRGTQSRMLPFSSLPEGWSFLAWGVVVIYLSIALRPRLPSLGAFALPAALVGVLVAAATPASTPILSGASHWGLALHVAASILSIGAFALAFACAICYLAQDHLLKAKRLEGLVRSLPPLGVLDTTSYWLIALGFCLLTVGMISGIILVPEVLKASWIQRPDTYATLLLWLTFAVYLYVRGVGHWRGRRTHTVVVIAVAALLIVYGGVILLLRPATLHGGTLISQATASAIGRPLGPTRPLSAPRPPIMRESSPGAGER